MERFSPARTAVMVVDMQNDFCAPGGRADQSGRDIGQAERIVPRIRALIGAAREAGCKIVYLQNTTFPDGRLSSAADRLRREAEWGDDPFPTAKGTWGHRIIDALAPLPEDLVVEKVRQSGFVATPLDLLLRSHGLSTHLFTGVATHACVEATLRDAMNRDYEAILVRDCVAALEEPLHHAGLAVMESLLPRQWVVTGAELEQWIRQGASG